MDIVYPAYDKLDLRANLPAFWDPTFRQLLGLYDKVMWYSDAAPLAALGQQAILEIAASPIQNYLNAGGKLLVTASFPVVFSTVGEKNRSPLFGFTPMDSFSTAAGQARIPINNPLLPLAPGLDTLVCSAFVTGADPFYAKSSLNDLYTATLTTSGGWTGPRTVCGRTVYTNGQTSQVFFSVDLFKFNGDPAALQETLSYILTTELGW
jgi:hypothetical protein